MDIDREISKAHLNSGGWRLESHNNGNPIEAHACFYAIDMERSKIVLATTSKAAFDSVPVNEEANAFAGMIRDAVDSADGSIPTDACGPLIAYTKATQVYKVWQQRYSPDERKHIIVMLYASGARPVMTAWPSTVVDHDSVLRIAGQVAQQDRAAHPEWF